MDYKQLVLITGLAIVSYLLLLAWNDDESTRLARQPAASELTENNSDFPAPLPEPESISAEDLPAVEAGVSVPSTTSTETGSEISSATLITISTPVHDVVIDLRGGDIVSLSLPQYPTAIETPDDPFILLRNDSEGVYIAQSGLVGEDGPDANPAGRPVYTSAQNNYQLDAGTENLVVDLVYDTSDAVILHKRFSFSPTDYLIQVDYIIENNGASVWRGNHFAQIKRDGAPDSSNSRLRVNTYLGAALTTDDDPYKKVDLGDMDNQGTAGATYPVVGGWIAFSQHYFLSSWIPDATTLHTYSTRKNSAGEYIMGFVSPETSIPAGSSASISSSFWAGPKDQYRLQEISPNLGLTIDYGWLWFIASPIFWLLTRINDIIGNYGWSIIVLTIVIKSLLFRLSTSSYRSMAKMRRLAPKVAELKDRYGEDKQKLMHAQMELWKKEKVNPMGGCLPMLIQLPVFLSLYWVLNESVELRQAPFILWYQDLSVMDPYFILPLIMGASMFVSQQMTPMSTMDPMQAKIMKFMPVIFTLFFLWFPAGLVLYWVINNLFTICQQWYIYKKVDESYKTPKAT